MLRLALLMTVAALLAACSKFDSGLSGPEPVPGTKAQWRTFGVKPDYEFLVDVGSIGHYYESGPDGYTYVWVLQKFKTDQEDEREHALYRDKYALMAIDCPSGRMAGIAVELRNAEDRLVARYDVPGYQWQFETPVDEKEPGVETYGQNFVSQICKIMAEKDAKKDKEE